MYKKTCSNLTVIMVVALLLLSHLTTIALALNNGSSSINENADLSKQSSAQKETPLAFNVEFGTFSDYISCITAEGDSVQLIIGVNPSNPQAYNSVANVVASNRGKIVNTVSIKGNVIAVVADIPLNKVSSFREQTSKNPIVRYVEPNMKRQALLEPNDPCWIMQWGPKKVEANWAWNITLGSTDVIVAVVDTGIYYYHEDLAANYVSLGYDWVNRDNDPLDDHGHGTHCAGIIAAAINNNRGIAGLAQVKIMAEKVLDRTGYGYDDWVANGIIHAADSGAKIISMSLGGYGYSRLLHEAVKYAYEKGVLLVAAAGNDNTNAKVYPAAYEEVIAVAATDEYDKKAYFSNWGDWIELSAPGTNIYSTVPWGYTYANGTSMACPHVSGVAALIWSLHSKATNYWIRAQLRFTVDDLGVSGFDAYFGYGRVNARKAIEQEPPERDLLILGVQGPQYVRPGDAAFYNVTVLNFGKRDEIEINVSLIVDGKTVGYRYVDFIASGSSAGIIFSWIPLAEGRYNVTFWVKPVVGEVNTLNNKIDLFLIAIYPLINPAEGQWASYENSLYDLKIGKVIYSEHWNITYERYIDSYRIYVKIRVWNDRGEIFEGWMIVNVLTRLVEEGVWAGLWYPGWIEKNITIDSTVNLLYGTATVTGSRVLLAGIYPIDCWELTYWEHGYQYLFWYDKATGLWIGMDYQGGYHYRMEIRLKETNIRIGEKYPHDLAVTLEAPLRFEPGSTTILNATVYNIGLNDERNVRLSIFINGAEVVSKTLDILLKNTTHTINYKWTPQIEAFYNVTAYVQPLPDEFTVLNNVAMNIVRVVGIRGHVLFDQTHQTDSVVKYSIWIEALEDDGYVVEVLTTTPINETAFEGYDIFIIPQARDYYTPNELNAIKDFVRNGGGLLVLGDDAPYIYTEITSFAGIGWDLEGSGYGGYTMDITPHPITEGVISVYFSYPGRLIVSSPAQGLIRDRGGNVILAVAEVGLGAVACLADENSIDNNYISYADNLRLAVNMVSWLTNRPPYVYVKYSPLDPYVGEVVTFDASASYDPDGLIVNYVWDFGDGTVEQGGAMITHVYVGGGIYMVSCTAVDNEGSSKTLKIEVKVQRTTLNVQAKVGAIHFAGEIAEFYILVSSLGEPVKANLTALLYFNRSLYADLTKFIEMVSSGFYRIPYTIPQNACAGTYVLVVEAKYYSISGTCLESFLVSRTLTNWSIHITEIKDGVATVVMPNLNEIRLNLTAMGVTLQKIFVRVNAINGTTARIETTLGFINGTVTEMNNNIATIVVPGLGQIQTDVSDLIGSQEAWTIPQHMAVVFSLVAAVGAVLSFALLLKLRKLKI